METQPLVQETPWQLEPWQEAANRWLIKLRNTVSSDCKQRQIVLVLSRYDKPSAVRSWADLEEIKKVLA